MKVMLIERCMGIMEDNISFTQTCTKQHLHVSFISILELQCLFYAHYFATNGFSHRDNFPFKRYDPVNCCSGPTVCFDNDSVPVGLHIYVNLWYPITSARRPDQDGRK